MQLSGLQAVFCGSAPTMPDAASRTFLAMLVPLEPLAATGHRTPIRFRAVTASAPPDVQATYDTVAADYARLLPDLSVETPLDVAMIGTFANRVREAGLGPVADIGCGAGRVTAHLDGLGVKAFGIDLSPGMVDVARATYPQLRFDVGSMTDLKLSGGTLGGVLAWYSIIHTPPQQLPDVFVEFFRVLAPGGQLLLGFHVGDERRRMSRAYGHDVSCDSYRLQPDDIAELLTQAGFDVHTRLLRAPAGCEKVPQASLLAGRPQ
jgi:SAM-dependent methyltransferase